MSVSNEYEILLNNLAGEIPPGRLIYLERNEARRQLVTLTGQDFGDDVEAWTAWLTQNGFVRQLPPRDDASRE